MVEKAALKNLCRGTDFLSIITVLGKAWPHGEGGNGKVYRK